MTIIKMFVCGDEGNDNKTILKIAKIIRLMMTIKIVKIIITYPHKIDNEYMIIIPILAKIIIIMEH